MVCLGRPFNGSGTSNVLVFFFPSLQRRLFGFNTVISLRSGSNVAQIYNLGNTNPHTVTELVDLLERGLNRKAQRNLIPMPATGDVLATFADISAAKAVRHPRIVPLQPKLSPVLSTCWGAAITGYGVASPSIVS